MFEKDKLKTEKKLHRKVGTKYTVRKKNKYIMFDIKVLKKTISSIFQQIQA